MSKVSNARCPLRQTFYRPPDDPSFLMLRDLSALVECPPQAQAPSPHVDLASDCLPSTVRIIIPMTNWSSPNQILQRCQPKNNWAQWGTNYNHQLKHDLSTMATTGSVNGMINHACTWPQWVNIWEWYTRRFHQFLSSHPESHPWIGSLIYWIQPGKNLFYDKSEKMENRIYFMGFQMRNGWGLYHFSLSGKIWKEERQLVANILLNV